MPHPALSLLGFLDQQAALAYMANLCVFPSNDPTALTQEWQAAQQNRGPAIANAGHPHTQSLAHPHVQGVQADPHFAAFFGQVPWEFAVVEVAPLLAYQFHVLTDAAQAHCANVPSNPSIDDMLPICLPLVYPRPTFHTYIQAQGVLVEATDVDIAVHGMGRILLNPDPNFHITAAGLVFSPPNPWVLVSEFQGRYFLSNGYHRVYGLSQRGASAIPCILIHATSMEHVGIKGGLTFDEALLASSDPPTCAHFTGNRAHPVVVRHIRKRLALNWSVWDLREE